MLSEIFTHRAIQTIGNILFFLLILVLMVDPGNAILHLKDKIFVCFVGYNILFLKPDIRYLAFILPIYLVIAICFVLSTIQQVPIDLTYTLAAFKGFAPLILLLWIPHYNVLKLVTPSIIITSLIILILYTVIVSVPELENLLFLYSKEHNEMVMLTRRNWLGVNIFGMYYRSVVTFLPLFFISTYYLFSSECKSRIKVLLVFVILFATFLISGTRAMFLTPFAILGVVIWLRFLTKSKARYFLYPIFALVFVMFLILIIMMATQEGDQSNNIKYGHLVSYADLFNEQIWYTLWGQGPGSMFYSEGFGRMTAETEWTYLELVRNYGVFSIVIFFVYIYPLYCCFKFRRDNFMIGMGFTYTIFLLVGGTNPFLLNSQGMTMVWIMYSYLYNNDAVHFIKAKDKTLHSEVDAP